MPTEPTEKMLSIDRLIAQSRPSVEERLNASAYNLRSTINEYTGTSELTSGGRSVLDALLLCYTLQDAIHNMSKEEIFRRDTGTNDVFRNMYSFYIGTSQALERLNAVKPEEGIKRRGNDIETPFKDLAGKVSLSQETQVHDYLMAFKNGARNQRVRKGLNILDYGIEYFSAIRSCTLNQMQQESVKGQYDHARTLKIRYNGTVIDGFRTGLSVKTINDPGCNWDSFAGYELQKAKMQEIARFVKNPEKAMKTSKNFFDIYPNILLHGAPGTGKSRLAEIFAAECGVPIKEINIATIASSFVNGTNINLKKELDEAARPIREGHYMVAVAVLDEIDAITRERAYGTNTAEQDNTTSAFLLNTGVQNQQPGLILIGTTNAGGRLSKPVRERFPQRIIMPLPDAETRAKILKHFLESRNKDAEWPPFKNVDADLVAERSITFKGLPYVGRDFESLMGLAIRTTITRRERDASYSTGTKDLLKMIEEYNRQSMEDAEVWG